MTAIRRPILLRPLPFEVTGAGNETPEQPASHLALFDAIGLTWRSTDETALTVYGDFGAAKTVDFCAVIAANAQPGTTWRLRVADTQDNCTAAPMYDSGAIPFIDPAIEREDGLYNSFLELPAAETPRFFLLSIGGHAGPFEAAAVVIGEKVEPSHFYNLDHEYGAEDMGELEITRYGVVDEQPGVIWRSLDFALEWQSEAEFEARFRPMMEGLGKRGVLYCCFDPAATVYRQARTYMGFLKKPLFARGTRKPRTFLQEFSILSMI